MMEDRIHDLQCSHKFYRNNGNLPLLEFVPHNSRVLDCGCGAGDNARILRSRGCQIVGITISPTEREAALTWCESVLLANLERGLPREINEQFDVVLLSHVLEHLVNPDKVLKDIKEHLTRNGILAVALPNTLYYPVRFRFMRGVFEYTNTGILDITHMRFYTYKTGIDLLKRNGYDIIVSSGKGKFPLWKLRSMLPSSLVDKINQAACKAWPGLFGAQLLYIAKPANM